MMDLKGRVIDIRMFEERDYLGLRKMYDGFEPKGLEAGLPPPDEKIRLRWLDGMVSDLLNVLAFYRRSVIGHASLDLPGIHDQSEFSIFITKGFRYCGIGTRLSEIMRDLARNAGCKKVWLTVRTGNAIAVKVFKKVGNAIAVKVFKKVGFEFIGSIDIQREMELIIKKTRGKT